MSNIPEEAKRLREMWGGFRTYSMKDIKRWLLEPGFKDIKERFMDETVLIEGFLNFSGPLHPPIKRVSLMRDLIRKHRDLCKG